MNYIYSSQNRLKNPHNYMYTKYEGREFISSYFESRKKITDLLTSKKEDNFSYFEIMLRAKEIIENYLIDHDYLDSNKISITVTNNNIKLFNLNDILDDEEIDTRTLLFSTLNSVLHQENKISVIEFWLDRLIQRFEVTKKIYETYKPGFRKGFGRNDDLSLYFLLSLILSLRILKTRNYKYLNTLLKLNDLICSIKDDKNFPNYFFSLLIQFELDQISKIIKEKEIDIETF